MAHKIDIVTKSYGFDYCIGSLIIARGKWAKRSGDWCIRLFYMEALEDAIGIAVAKETVMPINKILGFLNDKMRTPILTKEDMT